MLFASQVHNNLFSTNLSGAILALPPIVVDLDGTLIYTDMLHETALRAVREDLANVFRIPFWLLQGKAVLKTKLARCARVDLQLLPYNTELIEWLKDKRLAGHRLVLCTASDHSIAQAIARRLNIFDEVIASDGRHNLSGISKAARLEQQFGQGNFDYAGNSAADLPVWERARHAIVVNASPLLTIEANNNVNVHKTFPRPRAGCRIWSKVVRIHQWLKNLLLFAPLVAAHDLTNGHAWASLVLAFLSFSLCASSVYITNDLLDIEHDRLHPLKRKRPLASGRVPIWQGVCAAPLLFILSLVFGYWAGWPFLQWLVVYFLLTCLYSLWLKRLMLVDCFTLALLYTLRIIAGAAAIGVTLTFWLLAFSIFLFLSLAFVKRYAEMEVQLLSGKKKIHGRGYLSSDAQLIQTLGIMVGCLSVLVLALYLNSDDIAHLYRSPEIVWIGVPTMLFWISWIWMQAHRGNMHEDPVIFAVKDRVSLVSGLIFAALLVLGSIGLP
ncbi:UbiA family prenyltransferase [Bordetella muralis]|uniref:UbiA family prenyltransferase n=1 Tax=Bordetella muralis TaxID=1649130 RepID=UPI0039EE2901